MQQKGTFPPHIGKILQGIDVYVLKLTALREHFPFMRQSRYAA